MDQILKRQMQHAGIDVNELVKSLILAARLEFWAFYAYCAVVLKPLDLGTGLWNLLEGTRIDHQTHFNDLLQQIRGLDGMLPDDIREFVRTTDQPYPALHSKSEAIALLSALEQSLIAAYTAICDRTAGKDLRTYEFSLGILRNERDHLLRLEEWARFMVESERQQSLINDYSRLAEQMFRLEQRLTDEVSEVRKSQEDLYELLLPMSEGIDTSDLKVHRYLAMSLYLPKADPVWTEAIPKELVIFARKLAARNAIETDRDV